MESVTFRTVAAPNGAIAPPEGITLPSGEIEVTVRPLTTDTNATEGIAPTHSWLLELVEAIEREGPDAPADLAARHDYYAHGKKR